MDKDSDMPTLVVGVDGSPSSAGALEWAAREAQLRGAKLHVVQVWEVPGAAWATPVGVVPYTVATDENVRTQTREDLAGMTREVLGPDPKIKIRITVAEGNPAKVLIDIAKRDDAELLVVGSRGRGGFKTLLLGSVSEQCVTHARCPVIVIRPQGK
ncbi:MAG: universal stress protein [Actinomycetes bacterium]